MSKHHLSKTSLFLSFALLLVTGCAHAPAEPGDGILPIIDAHTHNHFSGKLEMTSHIPDTLEQY